MDAKRYPGPKDYLDLFSPPLDFPLPQLRDLAQSIKDLEGACEKGLEVYKDVVDTSEIHTINILMTGLNTLKSQVSSAFSGLEQLESAKSAPKNEPDSLRALKFSPSSSKSDKNESSDDVNSP
mmetsp:Transcript_27755/g.38361  ORF Transcript_27755/g.38361 Transcript_27755/m.38361 type:complete len:123 (+) Transcript_27755:171-539(+)|eukprot:CAMPEP_0196597974 /NCGR_PEP_ID=MMETSP1081-20130531/94035_1 /TAXON_ID=36882 /ORGANISM="Pyramimonas amylifera, Strain CCMP720" /LENGTH=122 /DNA_ID=CAMNT_0041923573 /DNA_START=156 /DNA_END=524 /DNA_ORIENTATION=+